MIVGPRFTLKGFEPPAVRTASLSSRRAFWTAVSQFVIEAKDAELRAGLDRFGKPMASLKKRTIERRHSDMGPADPHAPALQPAHGLSRTRSLFTAQPTRAADGVTCWWLYDDLTAASWGEMLAIHRAGNAHLPKRDVIGLSIPSVQTVANRARSWWNGYAAASTAEAPPGAPGFTPRSSGWGRATPLPGTGPRTAAEIARSPTASPGGRQWTDATGHVYTMQGGMGLNLPKGPPAVFASRAPKPKPPKPPSFGPSKAPVTRQPDVPASLDVASLVGAPHAADVTAMRLVSGGVYINAKGEGYEARVVAYPGHLEFSSLYIDGDRQGKGLGTEIVGRMIEAASKPETGLAEIKMWASREHDDVGYKVWPKLGFNGELPEDLVADLPESLASARLISDLMMTPEGVAWWNEHGETIGLTFDLSRGSLSRRIWDAYLIARASKAR